MKIIVLSGLTCLLLVCAGCAPRSLTLSEARGSCFTYSTGGGLSAQNANSGGGGGCGDINPICEAFLDEGRMGPLDREQCLAACEQTRMAQYAEHMVDGCKTYAKRAYELCDVYCRGK